MQANASCVCLGIQYDGVIRDGGLVVIALYLSSVSIEVMA